MYLTYLQYCQPGVPFYEKADVESPESYFPLHRAALAEGWTREVRPEWIMYAHAEVAMPWQGWKIHVSATKENAEDLLTAVAAYCFERRIPFKALSSVVTLRQRNSKYADRGGSGKFLTLYPPAPEVLATALHDLDALIGGAPGPTILSDLRFNEGPLYVRYGAFVSRRVTDAAGRQIECVEDPEGRLVPDERRPGFHPPKWAEIPEVLGDSLRARGARRLTGFPYKVTRALHFSNGGGVYLAERPDAPGRTILLKEARPYCGLDESGRDAIERLDTERAALTDLAGLPGVPAVDAYVDGVEHKFLGRAYVEGRSLMDLALERNPFVTPDSPNSPATYAKWVAGLVEKVARTVDLMHARGWVFGDLHPGNIIVNDADGSEDVHFIDFESASQDLDGYAQTMGVFGYRAPHGYLGRAVDHYALGCMRIGLLLPMTRLLALGNERAEELCRAATERFGLEEGYFDGVAELIAGPTGVQLQPGGGELGSGSDAGSDAGTDTVAEAGPVPPPAQAFEVPALAEALRAWRDAERTDRLHPGDVRQYLLPGGGLGLAYGAAGALWTLRECGGEADPADLEWLRQQVWESGELPVGFYTGLAGIAHAVRELDPEFSSYCLERALSSAWGGASGGEAAGVEAAEPAPADGTGEPGAPAPAASPAPSDEAIDISLGSGLSGLGAYLLSIGERAAAERIAARIPGALPADRERIAAGLVDGAAGVAVFLQRAATDLHQPEYAQLARELLDLEVTRFGLAPGADPVTAALPAFGTGLATGVLGLGLALHDHALRTGDDRYAAPLGRITALAQRTAAAHNGLLNGRLGLVHYLLAVAPEAPASREAIRRALAEAAWHTAPLGPHRLAIGDETLKFSLDLGTGLAGLVLTDKAVRDGTCALPLFETSSSRSANSLETEAR